MTSFERQLQEELGEKLLEGILTHVFTAADTLRHPIYAVEKIVECIEKNLGNGYAWRTQQRKTLTSSKASTLLKTNRSIDRCPASGRKDLVARNVLSTLLPSLTRTTLEHA